MVACGGTIILCHTLTYHAANILSKSIWLYLAANQLNDQMLGDRYF